MMRIESAYRSANRGATLYNRIYARLVNPAGPLDGRRMRVHAFFPLLAVVCLASAPRTAAWRAAWACFWCWWLRLPVRETARLLVAAWLGLRLRAILLLPIGGLFAYANPESQENANQGGGQFAIALAGPLANGPRRWCWPPRFWAPAAISSSSASRWITAAYLLRSMVWMQAGLGLLHLLPAYPLDCGRLLRGSFARKHGLLRTGRAAAGLGQVLALAPWWPACCCTTTG
jgi:Zn-dependent protease